MANLTNGRDTCHFRDYSGDDSDDDEDTFSLPSFSNSIRLQVDAARKNWREQALGDNLSASTGNLIKSTSVTSLKEFEDKLNELRRENFNLKLRLYYLEKGKSGITKPDYEKTVVHEVCKKDALIKSLQKQLEDRDEQIKSLKSTFETTARVKDLEMDRIKSERDRLREQLNSIKNGGENMGRAISGHLKKIEHLLETTSMYVQEIQ